MALYGKEVEKVATLMQHLRTSKQKAVLRKMGCSMPVVKNTTRWSSSYLMINRYLEMAEHLDDMDMDLTALLPTPREKIKIKSLFEDLRKFQSVNMELQHSDGVQLKDVRILFDELLETFEEDGTCAKHLPTTAKVVASPAFGDGIVKVYSVLENDLTPGERRLLVAFEKPTVAPFVASASRKKKMSFAQVALQEKQAVCESKYVNLAWIPPTSDDVERLFSQAGQIYNEQRQEMLPANLELLLFLRFNRSLWDEVAVARVLRARSDSMLDVCDCRQFGK
ncbi:hypothetical protein JG687_00010411 [Phytophthora cactorum]|uniref:HAT C-terminal dimerisation domain-containing protein n=1 Tax=Phytophthora cactorum TaxID=29920 RepID=A0A8T1U793_9STRA|nr:hypothetical protein PC123_g16324 [Phytophthora cactorum]KAG6956738.1 hypothetical protein JG687_00010411 [Phytophthora cactorum]